jgi:hypothetical protein
LTEELGPPTSSNAKRREIWPVVSRPAGRGSSVNSSAGGYCGRFLVVVEGSLADVVALREACSTTRSSGRSPRGQCAIVRLCSQGQGPLPRMLHSGAWHPRCARSGGWPKRSDQRVVLPPRMPLIKRSPRVAQSQTAVLACRTKPSLVVITAQCMIHGIPSLNSQNPASCRDLTKFD